jgi:predicted RNA-binding protein YlqC (UPF0109 family)
MTEHYEHCYQKLFRLIAEGIIYKPDQMLIREVPTGRNNVTLFVQVHAEDIGLLCGKFGKTIKAIQTIFQAIGKRKGDFVRIAVDKVGEYKNAAPRFQAIETWDRTADALLILSEVLAQTQHSKFDPKFEVVEQHDTTLITLKEPAVLLVDDDLFEAMTLMIRAWGLSLGRHVFLLKPGQIKT